MALARRKRLGRRLILPLLHALKTLKPDLRVIVLEHLDDRTKDELYRIIGEVLRSDKVPFRKRLFLKGKLEPYKKEFRCLARDSTKAGSARKGRTLAQVGAGPMTHVLRLAIPLLLNVFPK